MLEPRFKIGDNVRLVRIVPIKATNAMRDIDYELEVKLMNRIGEFFTIYEFTYRENNTYTYSVKEHGMYFWEWELDFA